MANEIDETVDEIRVDPPEDPAEREHTADDDEVVDLVDVVLVFEKTVNGREPRGKPAGRRPGLIALVEAIREEDPEAGNGNRDGHEDVFGRMRSFVEVERMAS